MGLCWLLQVKEGKVYSGSHFGETVYHGGGGTGTGAEAAGHIVSTVRKHRKMALVLGLFSPDCSGGDPLPWSVAVHRVRVGLPTST